jgi:hypothetical protein
MSGLLDIAATLIYNKDPLLGLFDLFLQRYVSEGVYLHPSLHFIQTPESGFGIACRESISLTKNTVIARIPKKFILSVRAVSNLILRKTLLEQGMLDVIGLSISYLYECSLRSRSPWYPYLNSFAACCVPLAWEENARELVSYCGVSRDHSRKMTMVHARLNSDRSTDDRKTLRPCIDSW